MNVAVTVRRAFASNLKSVTLTGAEQAALQAEGIVEPTALGADLFMRMNVVAWKQGRTLEGTAAAKSYDDAMGRYNSR